MAVIAPAVTAPEDVDEVTPKGKAKDAKAKGQEKAKGEPKPAVTALVKDAGEAPLKGKAKDAQAKAKAQEKTKGGKSPPRREKHLGKPSPTRSQSQRLAMVHEQEKSL